MDGIFLFNMEVCTEIHPYSVSLVLYLRNIVPIDMLCDTVSWHAAKNNWDAFDLNLQKNTTVIFIRAFSVWQCSFVFYMFQLFP